SATNSKNLAPILPASSGDGTRTNEHCCKKAWMSGFLTMSKCDTLLARSASYGMLGWLTNPCRLSSECRLPGRDIELIDLDWNHKWGGKHLNSRETYILCPDQGSTEIGEVVKL